MNTVEQVIFNYCIDSAQFLAVSRRFAQFRAVPRRFAQFCADSRSSARPRSSAHSRRIVIAMHHYCEFCKMPTVVDAAFS